MNDLPAKFNYKERTHADNIIRYLLNPNDPDIKLNLREKATLDVCKKVHGYRLAYNKKRDIVNLLAYDGISERMAYNYINITEEIFGRVEGVHKDYERNFLIEESRNNVAMAKRSGSSIALTKAILAHYRVAGLDEFIPDMPDFTKLEQHKYFIDLPAVVIDALKALLKSGALNLKDILPPPKFGHIEEAKAGD